MDKYVCSVCGYVYDPEAGDPDNDIDPGTSFEDLPDDWTCPVCGAGKDEFEKEGQACFVILGRTLFQGFVFSQVACL